MDLFGIRLQQRNVERLKRFNLGSKAVVLNSFFVTRLKQAKTSDCRRSLFEALLRWLSKSTWSFSETKTIFCPFLANSHWFLLVVQLDYDMIVVYDSFPRITATATEAAKLLADFLQFAQRKLEHAVTEWILLEKAAYPEQSDRGSCGIFVSWVMEYLERGAVPSFTQDTIPLLRKKSELFIKGYSIVPLELYDEPRLAVVKQEAPQSSKDEFSAQSAKRKNTSGSIARSGPASPDDDSTKKNDEKFSTRETSRGVLDDARNITRRSPSKRAKRPPKRFQ
ncbi:Ulp1 protease [Gracilaria domingensis]|nr:Ulp1 protease [Gracilaria domingensis]